MTDTAHVAPASKLMRSSNISIQENEWEQHFKKVPQNRNVLLSLHVINNSFTLLPFISGYDIVFCQRFLIYVWRIYLIAKVDHA